MEDDHHQFCQPTRSSTPNSLCRLSHLTISETVHCLASKPPWSQFPSSYIFFPTRTSSSTLAVFLRPSKFLSQFCASGLLFERTQHFPRPLRTMAALNFRSELLVFPTHPVFPPSLHRAPLPALLLIFILRVGLFLVRPVCWPVA